MKRKIVPLPKTAKAVLPNTINKDKALSALRPLTLHMLLYVTHLWRNRNKTLKDVVPSKRTAETRKFTVGWAQLQAHLRPDSVALLGEHDYRNLYEAANQLFELMTPRYPRKFKRGRVALFQRVDEEADGAFTFYVSEHFEQGWNLLALEGFTLVPLLEDAFALFETRQIRMLMLLCEVEKINLRAARTFSVDKLREIFGFKDPYYDDWRQVASKLKDILAVVGERTNYSGKMRPIFDKLDGRRVIEVEFSSKHKERTYGPPETLTLPASSKTETKKAKQRKPRKLSYEAQELEDARQQSLVELSYQEHRNTKRRNDTTIEDDAIE